MLERMAELLPHVSEVLVIGYSGFVSPAALLKFGNPGA
jgi:hypothetical protein